MYFCLCVSVGRMMMMSFICSTSVRVCCAAVYMSVCLGLHVSLRDPGDRLY